MPTDFTIGADPEFLCFQRGSTTIQDSSSSPFNGESELGEDGSGVPFEIRPKPSSDPLQVVSNIRAIVASRALAGSYHNGAPIGGHIHLGFSGGRGRHPDYSTISRILDNYVGVINVLVEKRQEGSRRRATGYGMASEYRTKRYGIEYRTPGSWVTSPYVAAGFLCLTKAVVHEVLEGTMLLQDASTSSYINSNRVSVLRDYYTTTTRPSITTLSLYPTYKPYLDFLDFLITNRLTWYPKVSMKQAWGIVPTRQYPQGPTLASIWRGYSEAGEIREAVTA